MVTCTISQCARKHNARGLCSFHEYRLKKHGSPHIDTLKEKQDYYSIVTIEWIELYKQGVNTIQIARLYNCSTATVWNKLKPYGILRGISLIRMGENNPMWKSVNAGSAAIHKWVKRHMQKPELCEQCLLKPPFDLANISNSYNSKTYTRDFSNWEWLCRRCHMIKDGRLFKLAKHNKASST